MGVNEIVAIAYFCLFLPMGGLFIVYLWIPSSLYNSIIENFWFMDCKGLQK